MSRHNVLPGPGSNVQSQRACCSFNTLVWNAAIFSVNDLIAGSLSYLSLVFSTINLSTNEDDDLTVKLSGLFPDTIKTPTYPLSNHRQHSCLGLCLGTPHSDTRDELEIHLHTRNLTVVLDLRVPIIFPSGLDTDFAPRSSWQVSQVVSLHHGPAWRVLRTSQWNCTRVFSLNNLRVQVTSWFDVLHLHVDSSASWQRNQPSFSIGSTTHADASSVQTNISHKSSQFHSVAFFHSFVIHSDGSYSCTCC